MGVKLGKKYIKEKLRAKFGELEVYNALNKEYEALFGVIQGNSKQIKLENGYYNTKIDNVVDIVRYMLANLTNIESQEFWDSMDNEELEDFLNSAHGDFKSVIKELTDIIIEIGNDVREQSTRQLDVLANKIDELGEAVKYEKEIREKLEKLDISDEALAKIKDAIEKKKEEK